VVFSDDLDPNSAVPFAVAEPFLRGGILEAPNGSSSQDCSN
jgi:hypothetical protein